jgi:hypothetical protein
MRRTKDLRPGKAKGKKNKPAAVATNKIYSGSPAARTDDKLWDVPGVLRTGTGLMPEDLKRSAKEQEEQASAAGSPRKRAS